MLLEKLQPAAEFIDPWLRDKVNSGIGLSYIDKKENKNFLIYKEIYKDRMQSHIWGRVS